MPIESDIETAFWKRILSAVPDEPPAFDRIVTSLVTDLEINWALEGDVDLDITKTADTPLHLFKPVSEVSGYRFDFSWRGGEYEDAILHTYDEYNPQVKEAPEQINLLERNGRTNRRLLPTP